MSLPTFLFSTTAEEVASVFAGEIRGKNVLLTGTSLNGVGFETALAIAKHTNLLIVTGYNSERLKLTEAAIKKEIPAANIRRLTLDLSSLAAVRTAAAEVNAYPEPLHVASGTTSYVPRVVLVSSAAQALGAGVDLTTLAAPDPEKYEAFKQRSKGKINAYSVHPGAIVTNMTLKEETIPYLQALGILDADGKPNTVNYAWKTLPEGAATTVAAAFDPRLNDKPGAYLSDSTEANKDLAPHSSDPANAAKLWSVTEEIIGELFTF
ncbi:hypothetical protein DFH09DRAFT_1503189 [Mycena vulgaris]|nr:hypothetical protein DFH09DRAFT_1503189 [Mycena vulgaris]